MAKVIYKPKYSLSQISSNFFKLRTTTTLAGFIADNFSVDKGKFSNSIQTINSTPSNAPSTSLVQQVLYDYGNGPVSNGLTALTQINNNVINSQPISPSPFNSYLLYGSGINFKSLSVLNARDLVLKNLQMDTIVNYVSDTASITFIGIIDKIVIDLKNGNYLIDKYNSTVLVNAKILARIIINGTTT